MTQKIPRIFLETSVIIAAVLSPSGGARQVFYLGESGLVHLIV
jgi:predicted nucleic acid-binding protein